MDNQPHTRFVETPPGSPKSCMKGARKQLTFEEKVGEPSGEVVCTAPRKSTKVCIRIRSPGDNSSPSNTNVVPPLQNPPDIQFTQHFETSTPPANCTSNGSYDFVDVEPPEPKDLHNDPQLMDVASKFVNDIIQTATEEVTNRQKPPPETKPNLTTIARDILTTGRRSVWVQRAQGTVSKWFSSLCVKAQNTIRT